ncbi:MAG: amidohydrolase [Synergistaceae bacterium]|nr:amidohydrolase [Synergistaceae bacterium]
MSEKYLVGGTVLTGKGKRLENAALALKDGKIFSISSENEIRPSKKAEVFDLTGKIITPGLIDAHVHVGTYPEGFPNDSCDTNEMVDPLTPHLRVLDAIYPDDEAFQSALAGGVTCVQTLPGSANVIGGQGAIIKTKPDIVERMVMSAPSAMKAALGENPVRVYTALKKSPNTRMGIAALMREALVKAQNYRARKEAALSKKASKAGKADKNVFERDFVMESLLPVLSRELALCVHCHRLDDIQTAVRIAEEFNLNLTLEHCTEGHKIASWLAGKKVRAAIGPTMATKSKIEVRNKTWDTPRILWENGVRFCIISDHPVVPIEHLNVYASLAMRAGLPADEALKAITISAAEHLGIEDRVGSIEKGKDADIAVWDGEPLDSRSRVVKTFIDGELVYDRV